MGSPVYGTVPRQLAGAGYGPQVRLKSSVDISTLPGRPRIVAGAVRRYGVILADSRFTVAPASPSANRDNDAPAVVSPCM